MCHRHWDGFVHTSVFHDPVLAHCWMDAAAVCCIEELHPPAPALLSINQTNCKLARLRMRSTCVAVPLCLF